MKNPYQAHLYSCILSGVREVFTMNGMAKEKKAHEPFREGPAWQAARANGIDVSLLEDNLRLSPLERIRAHTRALNEALMLREAVKEQHARP